MGAPLKNKLRPRPRQGIPTHNAPYSESGLNEKRGHCRSGDCVAEMRPMPLDLAKISYGDRDENLLPEPATRSPFAKLLDLERNHIGYSRPADQLYTVANWRCS